MVKEAHKLLYLVSMISTALNTNENESNID